jgi:hypothetical protein
MLFEILLWATFAAHLLFMNAALGLCLIGTALGAFPGGAWGMARPAGRLPNILGLTINLGVAPLLFAQVLYGRFLYVSAGLLGPYWFGLILVVILVYMLAYRQKKASAPGGGSGMWAVMSLGLLYAAMVQTQSALLVIKPGLWAGYFQSPSGLVLAWGEATLIPRWLHFVLASLAVGGLLLAMTGRKKAKAGDPEASELVRQGMAWFSWATLAQVLDGVVFLVCLPREVMLDLMGGDPLATALFIAGLALAGLTLALGFKAKVMAAAGSLVATVAVMVVIREVVRRAYLKPYFDPGGLKVVSEPSTVVLFFVCLGLALLGVWWAVGHKAEVRS